MIEIEIIQSPDKDMIGLHTFYFDEIVLDNSGRSALIIEDKLITSRNIKISVTTDGLLCESIMGVNSFLSNGKKISGGKIHQKDDHITLGKTEIIIKKFSFSGEKSLSFSKKMEKAINDVPEIENVFYALEQELLKLES